MISLFCLRGSRTNRTLIRANNAPIFFRDHKSGPKNAVNFLDHDGPKKGCNPQPSAERFTFVRCEAMSKVQKRYSLVKSNRNAPLNPDCRLLFLHLFLFDNSDAEQRQRCVIARFSGYLAHFLSWLMVLYTSPRLIQNMGLYMFHNFIISWSTIYPIILYFYGLLYSPFYIQIMDNYIDHNLYFSWTYI